MIKVKTVYLSGSWYPANLFSQTDLFLSLLLHENSKPHSSLSFNHIGLISIYPNFQTFIDLGAFVFSETYW